MGIDERLRRELGSLAPADPSGVYERVVERRVRRKFLRRAQIAGLAVIVVAGSALGLYGLLKAFAVGEQGAPAAPHEGGILFIDRVGEQVGIFVVRPDGTGLHSITDLPAAAHPVWSPDRRRIAYIGISGPHDESDVYVMDADGTAIQRVTRSGGVGGGPTWSPDGSTLAYIDEGLWVIDVEGGGPRLLVEEKGLGRVGDPTWSPDGEQIAYSFSVSEPRVELSGIPDLWAVPAGGGQPIRLTNTPLHMEYGADWSPDGGAIVFTSDRDIGVLELASGEIRYLTGTKGAAENDAYDRDPAWSPDGTQILFASDRADPNVMRLYRMYADGSHQVLVMDRSFGYGLCCIYSDWSGDTPPIPEAP